MKSFVITLLAGLVSIVLQAQTIENINASFDGERVTISYILNHQEVNQKFTVYFYSSYDNYSQPLVVTGDAGENVLPGRAKRAVWEAKSVLPSEFDDDIRIKIKAIKMAAPKLNIEPLSLKAYKKGRTISMKWTGGYPSDKITIELIKNNSADLRVADQTNNSGSYDWKIPKNVKGKNYTLRLTNASQGNDQIESSVFNIKPKTPFMIKLLPVLAAGGALYFLTADDNGGGNGGGGKSLDVLPDPANPTG